MLEAGGARADEVDAAFPAALDEAGAFEDAKVPRNRGERDAKGLSQGGDGTFAALREADEDAEADGIAEGGKDGGEMALRVAHEVEYIRSADWASIDI